MGLRKIGPKKSGFGGNRAPLRACEAGRGVRKSKKVGCQSAPSTPRVVGDSSRVRAWACRNNLGSEATSSGRARRSTGNGTSSKNARSPAPSSVARSATRVRANNASGCGKEARLPVKRPQARSETTAFDMDLMNTWPPSNRVLRRLKRERLPEAPQLTPADANDAATVRPDVLEWCRRQWTEFRNFPPLGAPWIYVRSQTCPDRVYIYNIFERRSVSMSSARAAVQAPAEEVRGSGDADDAVVICIPDD